MLRTNIWMMFSYEILHKEAPMLIDKLCADNRSSGENLSEAMEDRNR